MVVVAILVIIVVVVVVPGIQTSSFFYPPPHSLPPPPSLCPLPPLESLQPAIHKYRPLPLLPCSFPHRLGDLQIRIFDLLLHKLVTTPTRVWGGMVGVLPSVLTRDARPRSASAGRGNAIQSIRSIYLFGGWWWWCPCLCYASGSLKLAHYNPHIR